MPKKTSKKKAVSKKKHGLNKKYVCDTCGLEVVVGNICSCYDTCDLMCCGKEMRPY